MDGKGNMAAIRKAGIDINGMNVLIIGAGSIVGVILLEMAKLVLRKVTLVNRSLENAETLIITVRNYTEMKSSVWFSIMKTLMLLRHNVIYNAIYSSGIIWISAGL